MADYIRPTPRNPLLGLLADALTGGVEWMRSPQRAQQMQGLGGLLAETGIPATVERLSYGEPLTTGRGMTTRLRPEAEAALMTLAPEAVPIGRAAMAGVRATKGLPVGASVRDVVSGPQFEALETARKNAVKMLGLPENNTAMDRARAMGFDTNVYHGTGSGKKILKEGFSLESDARNVGGIWTTTDKNYAQWIADHRGEDGSVIPLVLRNGKKTTEFDLMKEARFYAENAGVPVPKDAREAQEFLAGGMGWDAVVSDALHSAPSRSLKIVNFNDAYHSDPSQVTTAFVSKHPQDLRMPNAAFDPARINEPHLLAGVLPFSVLLDEENRRELENRFGGLLAP